MLEFSNLNKGDIRNLTRLTSRKVRRSTGVPLLRCESVLLIPGAQQYCIWAPDWISTYSYTPDPPIKTGFIASFIIPNLIVEEPLLLFGVNKLLLFEWFNTLGNKKKDWDVSYVKGSIDREITFTISDGKGKQGFSALIIKDEDDNEFRKFIDNSFTERVDEPAEEEIVYEPLYEDYDRDEMLKDFYELEQNLNEESYTEFFTFGRWMLNTIKWHQKQMEENSSKVLATFRITAKDVKFLQDIPKILSPYTSKSRLRECWMGFIRFSEGYFGWSGITGDKEFKKDKIHFVYRDDTDLDLIYEEFKNPRGSWTVGQEYQLIDDDGKNEYLFWWHTPDANALDKEQEYGIQLFENKQSSACLTTVHPHSRTELTLVCFGLSYGDTYFFDCMGVLKQLKGDDRKKLLNEGFGLRTHEQEKEFQSLYEKDLVRKKKYDDFIKKFRPADDEIKEGELEWMVIDKCWKGLELGKSYYVDEETYNEELADCMDRMKLSKEDVISKQEFLTNLPDLLAGKEDVDEEVPTPETRNLTKEIEELKDNRKELKSLLKLLNKLKK